MINKTVVLDSSVWIEIFISGPFLSSSKKALDEASRIIVPTTVLFEVYRKLTQSVSEDLALSAISTMSQYEVSDLSSEIALTAADLSIQHKLGMADSFLLAHASGCDGILVTLDNDFSGIKNVKVLRI